VAAGAPPPEGLRQLDKSPGPLPPATPPPLAAGPPGLLSLEELLGDYLELQEDGRLRQLPLLGDGRGVATTADFTELEEEDLQELRETPYSITVVQKRRLGKALVAGWAAIADLAAAKKATLNDREAAQPWLAEEAQAAAAGAALGTPGRPPSHPAERRLRAVVRMQTNFRGWAGRRWAAAERAAVVANPEKLAARGWARARDDTVAERRQKFGGTYRELAERRPALRAALAEVLIMHPLPADAVGRAAGRLELGQRPRGVGRKGGRGGWRGLRRTAAGGV
jgi:hypothetical protein